jgi:hypothetical protein
MNEQEQPKNRAEVIERILDFADKYHGVEFSFAHIVLGDFNLGDGHIQWCLEPEQVDKWVNRETERFLNRDDDEYARRYNFEQLEEVKTETIKFLNWLLTIPENIRKGVGEEIDWDE